MEKNLLEKLRLGYPISTREQILLTVQLSWPAIIAQLASIAMQYIDAAMVGRLGSNESAAIGLVASTTWLFNDLCIALTTGFNVKVAQSIGAQRKDLTYRLGWLTSALGMFLLCVTGALMYIFAPQMMSILSPDPAVIALGAEVLRIEAFTEPFYAAVIVCSGVFQGAGSALAATVLNFTTMWGIRVPLSALLAPRFGLHGVWFAMALQLGICGLLYLLRLWRKRWLPKDFLI